MEIYATLSNPFQSPDCNDRPTIVHNKFISGCVCSSRGLFLAPIRQPPTEGGRSISSGPSPRHHSPTQMGRRPEGAMCYLRLGCILLGLACRLLSLSALSALEEPVSIKINHHRFLAQWSIKSITIDCMPASPAADPETSGNSTVSRFSNVLDFACLGNCWFSCFFPEVPGMSLNFDGFQTKTRMSCIMICCRYYVIFWICFYKFQNSRNPLKFIARAR